MEDFLEQNYEKNMNMLNLAFKYCTEDYTHSELINELYHDDDLKKQFCLIELKKIDSQNEADAIVYNLTGKSGPVREAASFKILELIQNPEYKQFFQSNNIIDTFVKAVVDINPSVSRNMVQVIKFVDNFDYLYEKIIEQINHTLNKMDEIKQNRSYTTNKNNFNLYWNLEALINISNKINADEKLLNILRITAKSNDYTIREKTAKTANKLSDRFCTFNAILEILQDDTNIYVKKYL